MKYYEVMKTAQKINVSYQTLRTWHLGWTQLQHESRIPKDAPNFPKPIIIESRGKRIWAWKEEDIEQLKKFKEWLPKTGAGIGLVEAAKRYEDG